jgi:hypothetical protein
MNTTNTIEMAHYFGLNVEVICKLENSSLIRYRGRESIVDTTDLVFIRRLKGYVYCSARFLLSRSTFGDLLQRETILEQRFFDGPAALT